MRSNDPTPPGRDAADTPARGLKALRTRRRETAEDGAEFGDDPMLWTRARVDDRAPAGPDRKPETETALRRAARRAIDLMRWR